MVKLTIPVLSRLDRGHVITLGVMLSQFYHGSVTSPFTWLSLYLLVLHYSYIKRAALHCACPSCEAWSSFPKFQWRPLL